MVMADQADPFAPMFGDPITPWRKSFAIVPTWTVDAGLVWLRPVWWRRCFKHQYLSGGGPDFWFQYKRYV
jgi:hypothetical protein